MRFGGLIAATVVLAALAGGLYISNREEAKKASKTSGDTTAVKIVSLTEANITKIDVKRLDGENTALERGNGNRWLLKSPAGFAADQEAANGLSVAAASISADRVIEEKPSDLAGYGLKDPRLEVDLTTKDGKTKKILL